MSSDRRWQCNIVPLQIDGVDLQVAALVKPGTGTPLVFLHGFGSTKEDYADVAWHPDLGNRPVLAYDPPAAAPRPARTSRPSPCRFWSRSPRR